MDSLDKTDLKILINRRNITVDRFGNPLTAGAINSLNLASLREHLVMVTDAEIDFLGKLKEKRAEFSKVKLDELKTIARSYGQSGATKGELIDNILAAREDGIIPIVFDESQLAVLNALDAPVLNIYGGPGCGKTTLICEIIMRLDDPENLILVYNKNSKAILTNYLKRFIVKYSPIYTIDEYCYKLNNKIFADKDAEEIEEFVPVFDQDDKYVNIMSCMEALQKIKEEDLTFNTFILDEAQDIMDAHMPFIDEIRKRAKKSISIGDPRQALYGVPKWFLANKPTHLLKYNYRNSVDIVNYLNEFSKLNFGNYHFDMIPTRHSTMPIETVESLTTNDLAKLISTGKHLIISPITIEKFGMDQVIKSIRRELFKSSPRHIGGLFNDITISTTRHSKGYQCDNVIILPSETKFNRFTFTSISRAKNSCVLINKLIISPFDLPTGDQINIHRSKILNLGPFPNTDHGRVQQVLSKIRKIGKSVNFDSSKIISIDIENYNEYITEISAVVIGHEVEIFHLVSPGVTEITNDYHGEFHKEFSMGLKISNMTVLINSQAEVVKKLQDFLKKYPNHKLLRYSGSDGTKLGIATVDCYAMFKTWLRINDCVRTSEISLADAVLDLLGPDVVFVNHRAFEDALLTAAVCLAIT